MKTGFLVDRRRGNEIPRSRSAKVCIRTGRNPDADGRPGDLQETEVNGEERHTLISIDPVKGVALQRINAEDTWSGWLVIFHKELLADDLGILIVAIAAIVGLVSVITGVYLWWPKPGRWGLAFRIRRCARGAALLYDLHSVPAIWLLLPLALALASGLYIEKPDWIDPIVRVASNVRELPPTSAVSSPAGACPTQTSLDDAVALAAKGRDGQILRHAYLPMGPNGIYDIELRAPDASARADGDRIYVDRNCPKIVATITANSMTLGEKAKSWMWPIHADLLLGWVGKTFLFLAGLMLPVLFVTGFLFWLKTRRR